MFTPKNTSLISSPYTATPQSGRSTQSKRVASVFTPQSQRKHAKTQHNRSILQQSQLLEETSNFRVEKYGLSLPVLITEALTFADKSTKITVKTEDSGWAWLVGGRKLFVWRYKQTPGGRNIMCKELTLPPSDLAHSAARVCVIPNSEDCQSASCIAVSPEGVVRYWPNIAYEASSQEISAELKGEECDCVVNLQPYGCLLATTTSSLILIVPTPGQNTVSCKPLKAAHGMFAGISRRMSSLIFGGGPGQTTGAPLQAVIAGSPEEDEMPFYVLSGTHLQKWVIGDYGTDKFMYQIDADRLFREALSRKVWDQDAVQMTQLTTWILDVQLTSGGVMLLGAGLNLESQPVVHYALACIATDVSGTPSKLESFRLLQLSKKYEEALEMELLGYRFLLPDNRTDLVFMYNDSSIVMDTGSNDSPDELSAPGGKLLGAGVCDGTAVFFSITEGLISVSSTQKQEVSILDDTTHDVMARADVSTLSVSTAQIQDMSISGDKSSRLKAAFLSACGGNVAQAQEIIEELFPDSMVTSGNQTTEIDTLVTGLSRDLIDDYPTSDPRWAETTKSDPGVRSNSLIILQQIRDKQKAHEYIINFLKKLSLWDRLKAVKFGDQLMSTRLLLCQHAELLESAIILREIHSEYNTVIDPAIRKVLNSRGEQVALGLSPLDIFYREVSHIYEIIDALVEYEQDIVAGSFQPLHLINIISSVNSVIEAMLHAALQYRQTKADVYRCDTSPDTQPEYVPWTSTSGPSGVRTLVHKQFMLTLDSAVPESRDVETRGELFQQLLSLADNILDGYMSQLASLAGNQDLLDYTAQLEDRYVQERRTLIQPFLDNEQYERAGSLAEKYHDFEILIQICDKTGNQDRIQRYQQQFADKGFSDFLFSWYMREGKRGRLLSMPVPQQSQLQNFLQKDELGYLKWLHDIERQDFKSAHETLLQLGRNEEQYLARKKTLLGLSKLAALCNENFDQDMKANIQDIDDEQELILHQELLPADLLESQNIDPEYMQVLSPVELIQMYICEANSSATEYDFKKALDLLQFIEKDDPNVDYEQIKTSIWGSALLRDKSVWLHTPTGDPLDSVKDTILFKTISLNVNDGLDPSSFLPDMQQLLSSEILVNVSADRQLRFLLGTVYELVQQELQAQ